MSNPSLIRQGKVAHRQNTKSVMRQSLREILSIDEIQAPETSVSSPKTTMERQGPLTPKNQVALLIPKLPLNNMQTKIKIERRFPPKLPLFTNLKSIKKEALNGISERMEETPDISDIKMSDAFIEIINLTNKHDSNMEIDSPKDYGNAARG